MANRESRSWAHKSGESDVSRVFQREGAWWIDFKDARGVRRRKKVGPNKRIAKEVLDGILGSVARREHLGVIDDSPISFADFAKVWIERIGHTLKPRTHERFLGAIEKHLTLAFPGQLRGITASAAEKYVAKRLADGAQASTVNREMTVLKHMLRRAVAWEFLSRNPFLDNQGRLLEGLRPLREPAGRTRFLSLEEIDRSLAVCDFEAATSTLTRGYLRVFVVVALNTGMRRNEILSLSRRSVDWTNRIVTLVETKNGEPRHVHLNEAAYNALRLLPARIGDERLFPFKPHQITMAFHRAVTRAGIEDLRLHDTRHTFASYQAMAGVQGRGLQALLGHKDGRMTLRYSHLSDTYLKTAVNNVQLGRAPERSRELGTYLAPSDRPASAESRKPLISFGDPSGSRTRVPDVRGRCPNH
jgi:integrase